MAKLKAKKQTKRAKKQTRGKPLFRGFPWFVWLAIGLGIVAIAATAVFAYPWPTSEPVNSARPGELKAAIIDQLYSVQPNQSFIEQTTQELQDYGFEVDVYRGDAVTVDFYRQLPAYGYKLIIFRVHSGLLIGRKDVANKVWLFTSEPYSRMRHFMEQMTGKVTLATTLGNAPYVFAISAEFVTDSMKEPFNNTAIIMMGCSCFHFEDLAQAFIQKGASTYLAWDASVGLNYVDDAATALVEKLCSEELTTAKAVAEIMEEKGPDPSFRAVLKYYPPTSADKTLRQLIE